MCVRLFLRVFFLPTNNNSPLFLLTKFSPLCINSSLIIMAEHLASIFGTEKDRVNCPFYFKVREDQSAAVREIFFLCACWWCFPESNRIGSNWKSIHIEHSLTFLSLSLTLTLSRTPRRCGLSRTITKCVVGCCFHTTFAWDQNDTDRRVQTRRAMLSIA